MSEQLESLSKRVKTLEEWHVEVKVEHAIDVENRKFLNQKFNQMSTNIHELEVKFDTKFDKIYSAQSWLMKLIVGAIVVSFMAFVIEGGLSGLG